MTTPVHRFRMAMSQHLGSIITPEVAAQIEADAFHEPDRSIDLTQFDPQQCGSITLRAERLAGMVEEVDALTAIHWQETEAHRHGLPMRVDYDAMLAEERGGTLIQFTARCGDKLVGNFRLYLRVSRHTQTLFAIEDTLFLLPEYRRGRAAVQLLFYARKCLRRLGCFEYRATTKTCRPAAGRLLKFCGFKPTAVEWTLIEKEPDNESAA